MLKTQNVSYAYTSNATLRYPDLSAQAGETLLVLGASGCGKSTLLHLLAGLMKPLQGSITVMDTALEKLPGSSLDQFRGKNIGIVFQASHFVRSLNVFDNMKLAAYMSGTSISKQDIYSMLADLGLGDKVSRMPAQLSQGEQQRLAIGRALIHKPRLLLADEPTSALDDENCLAVYNLLQSKAREAGAALVIVTHDTRLKEKTDNHIVLQ